ncbi:MmpS family transport accessory protein [Actinoplanes sp. NPDC049118]|uniref:MmpS family transport accessory protein n=1 Tax=Actinoplanes sp. NPDC049118 TaxID=3155769 RepID=UPI0033EDDC01
MIDLDVSEEPQPRRRSRVRALVAAAVAVLVVAGGTTAFLIHRYRGTQVRFEVESASGTALTAQWTIGIRHVGQKAGKKPGEPFATPWSTTVTADDYEGIASLIVRSSSTDEVTCRIIVEGETVTELTRARVTGCVLGLDRLQELSGLDPAENGP